MWLRASCSNHDPGLIANYFLETVSHVGGYPARVRTDCGTENVTIAAIQSFVTGSSAGHLYGSSPVQSWWSFFQRCRSQWWIELFENLIKFDAFHSGHVMETECVRICFMNVIQKDLDKVRRQWNIHRIRPSTGSRCPPGIPDEMYYLPEPPYVDCMLTDVDCLPDEVLDKLKEPSPCVDSECHAYFNYLCNFHNWCLPCDADSAFELYFKLLQHIH